MSLHDEPNPAVQLATQAGKMAVSCPLRTTPLYVPHKKNFLKAKSFIDHASLSSQGGWILLLHSFFHSFME